MIKNFGLVEADIKILPEDFIFGADLGQVVVRPDGNWEPFLPKYEPQAENFETFGCTVWGSQNQIETYIKAVFGYEPNFSERFNYNCISIEPVGANPNEAYQSYRHDGLLNQDVLPVTATLVEFKTPRPVPQSLKDLGSKWGYTLSHEWITSSDMKSAIIDSLRYSPVGVSVTAWYPPVDGLYEDRGQQNTHWCMVYKVIDTPKGKALCVFDSYDHSKKVLHPDHRVGYAKRILITQSPVELVTLKKSLLSQLIAKLKELLALLIK